LCILVPGTVVVVWSLRVVGYTIGTVRNDTGMNSEEWDSPGAFQFMKRYDVDDSTQPSWREVIDRLIVLVVCCWCSVHVLVLLRLFSSYGRSLILLIHESAVLSSRVQ
jgi:hypothetical protein